MTLSGVYRFILEGRRSWLFPLTALCRAFRLLMRAVHSQEPDLLTLGLAVTTILTCLIWLSIQPKSIYVIVKWKMLHTERQCNLYDAKFQKEEFGSNVSCCRTLVVYDRHCILQVGFTAKSFIGDDEAVAVNAKKLMQG
ncbi:hypothetical protein CIPAW_05G144000 [Carya illinoinensis]|uniref:Uncharacterized protein n=2 Tax=Carya illinoinensis TaxID=32201 RepID=A0A8T1QJU9_CARIL|nr:hypothetical protein CIPAW_05G144000 [Carya illinoinensis]